ncbi:D-3-phosphoglycerate dehydrogenase [Tindallia magadiensis]|uniref:D-3-phosphoglycerate dehydrogenase n=1 Tax=Tindallia magadiensis TaxID=69895 RepID=A0A1I3APS9_9FIRM|nr:D-2-hydroxyacid dehydrogenase [Tindallia magadiensis]SFH52065.1 D-3-phosphoglycerate dehydrogenase [Tindallia magadiensis]
MSMKEEMKVLIADDIAPSAVKLLQEACYEVDTNTYSPEELKKKLGHYHVLVVRSATKVRKDLIDAVEGSNLELIVRAGVGLDNIDVDYAKSKGIEVKNTPNSSIGSVAELVLGHMLSLSRNLHRSNVTLRKGSWPKKEYKGRELFNSTLGIIGYGRIGRAVADKAKALGMKVQFYEIYDVQNADKDIKQVDMNMLLSTSDFITLHVPALPGKPPILGEAEFQQMKKGVYIINCARGGVLSEKALLKAIDDGIVAGAGLDVFEKEPPECTALLENERISLSPHIGANTFEAQERIGDELVEILLDLCERRHS